MNRLYKISDYLGMSVQHPAPLRLFSILVYSWFIVNAILVWPYHKMMWDTQNVFFRQGHADSIIENFAYRLIYAPSEFLVVFSIHLLAAVLSLFERQWSVLPRLITWLTALMLYYAAAEAFNSGMMLMMLLAFYSAFILSSANNHFAVVVTNLAAFACIFQIGLVYFAASMFKLGGEQWVSGTAVYYAMHIERFSSTWFEGSNLLRSNVAMHLFTWTAFAYQLLFPMMLFIRKGRGIFLLIGVGFHLFIGIFLHLWDFALAMIFSYAILLNDSTAQRIMKVLRLK
jgi:hypothetical protein